MHLSVRHGAFLSSHGVFTRPHRILCHRGARKAALMSDQRVIYLRLPRPMMSYPWWRDEGHTPANFCDKQKGFILCVRVVCDILLPARHQ